MRLRHAAADGPRPAGRHRHRTQPQHRRRQDLGAGHASSWTWANTAGCRRSRTAAAIPGIIVDQKTGEIFCFAVWMNGKPGKHQWTDDGSEPGYEIGKSAQFLMVRSQDDGRTWSKPENLTRKLKKEAWWLFAPSPQQGINLADGTLVMPVQGRDEQGRGRSRRS